MIPLRIATVAGDPDAEARLASVLALDRRVELFLRCVERAEALGVLRSEGAGGLVCVGAPAWFDRELVAEAAGRAVPIVGVPRDRLDVEALERLGVAISSVDPTVEELLALLDNAPVVVPSTGPPARGKVIAVWGPKGAPGRTTVALELAAEIAWKEPSSILIDCDTYGGDVAQLLGIAEELPTIVWASRQAGKGEWTSEVIATELRRAGQRGPVVLPGVPRSDLWQEISDFGWRELLAGIRRSFAFSVVDVGSCLEAGTSLFLEETDHRNHVARSTVRDADRVVAVLRADPVGIKNFLWSYPTLVSCVDPDAIQVVANMVPEGCEKEVVSLVRRHTGKRPLVCLPRRHAEVTRAVAAGRPLREVDPGGPLSGGIRTLAANLGAEVERSGVLTRLVGRA